MIELSVIRDLVAIFGVIAGFSYYVLTVRNAQRTRELTLKAQEQTAETRQAQLLMEIYAAYRSPEFRKWQLEIINQEWEDFDDFWEKYGAINNPEAWANWQSYAAFFHGIGVLLRKDLIDIDLVEELLVNVVIISWRRMSPILRGWYENIARVRFGEGTTSSKYIPLSGFEFLSNEMMKRDPSLKP